MKDFGAATIVYSKNGCPYCIQAKALLVERGFNFTEVVVDGVSVTRDSMNADLGRNDLTTVPQIVLNGQFIPGGYTGLKAHFSK